MLLAAFLRRKDGLSLFIEEGYFSPRTIRTRTPFPLDRSLLNVTFFGDKRTFTANAVDQYRLQPMYCPQSEV